MLAAYNDRRQPVIVEGIVTAEPDARDAHTNLRVETDKLVVSDQPTRAVHGLAFVQAPPEWTQALKDAIQPLCRLPGQRRMASDE